MDKIKGLIKRKSLKKRLQYTFHPVSYARCCCHYCCRGDVS